MEGEKMSMRFFVAAALAAVLLSPAVGNAQTWVLDADHTSVGFKVRHLMVSNVKGEFRSFRGTVETDERDVTLSKMSVTIDAASVNTGVKQRDDHLRSADFLDAQKYPAMTFVSERIAKAGERLIINGKLTIHGVTRPVSLDVEGLTPATVDPWGGVRRGATAVGKINRKDFGLTWNKALEAGGVVVGDEVYIILEVEMVRK
jgi:polyisoprenoid-binding protein YceI